MKNTTLSSIPSGLLLLNKEPGFTSFDALGPIKKALGTGKVGHTGTLDKFASGLLAILIGRALKLAPWFSSCDKEYEAKIIFGTETDTLDPEGSPVASAPLPSRENFERIFAQFTGEILQSPPAYSAIHINGKRASELARSGSAPEMKKRPVNIYSIELKDWSPPFATIYVRCSSGTYIRSLARDLAIACGSRAHLAALCRTSIGGFLLEKAFSFKSEKSVAEAIQPISPDTFERLGIPTLFINTEEEKTVIHGKPLGFLEAKLPDAPAIGLFSSETNGLIAVLERKDGSLHYGHVFAGISE